MNSEEVRQIARPFLLAIKEQMTETCGISVLDEKRLKSVVIDSVTGPDYVCFHIAPGTATPVYTSAPGKAFFANLPAKQRQQLLPLIRFRAFTVHTLSTPKRSRRISSASANGGMPQTFRKRRRAAAAAASRS